MEELKFIINIEAIGQLIKGIQAIESRDKRISDLERLKSEISTVIEDNVEFIQELIKNAILLNRIPVVVDNAVIDYVDIVLKNRSEQ